MSQLKTFINLRETWNRMMNAVARRGALFGTLVGLLPAGIILYGGYVFLIEPGTTENQVLEKKVMAVELEVRKGKAVEDSEPEFLREFTKVVDLFNSSLPLLPKETELSNILLSVQASARRYNVTLTGLAALRDAQKTPNADKFYEREIPAAAAGNYDDVMRFLLDVSRHTRILIVRDYAVQSLRDKAAGGRPAYVTVSFTLLAFHAPPPAEFPILPPGVKPLVADAAPPISPAAASPPPALNLQAKSLE